MWSSRRREPEPLTESDLILLDASMSEENAPLTARELRVAQLASDLAIKKMQDNFYKNVGRTVIDRWLIIIGAAFVAFAGGKGWLSVFFSAMTK